MSTPRCKYPRTPHLPWSPGAGSDDERLIDVRHFEGRQVVVTEKMDGENTSLYADGLHARSLDSAHHPSRDWLKRWHGGISHQIPQGWRLCGENLYARHSIPYENLRSYFYLFSIWSNNNLCLSWQETTEWAQLLDCPCPEVFYEGIWNEKFLQNLKIDPQNTEGYVVRLADSFAYDDFARSIGKWVRPHHVQTDSHWMHGPVTPNQLHENA